MTPPAATPFRHCHLLGIEDLSPDEVSAILDLSDEYVALNRQLEKKLSRLRGRTQINLFFETSTKSVPGHVTGS